MLGNRSVCIDAVYVLVHLVGEFEESGERYSRRTEMSFFQGRDSIQVATLKHEVLRN